MTCTARQLSAVIESYCAASGQSLNLEKSAVCFSKSTPHADKVEIANIFRIPISENPGTYLGIPSTWGKNRTQALAYIKERIRGKTDGWKANILSQAGREVLIKSIALAVPAYPMQIFLLPAKLCKAINSDLANFWWGYNDEKK